MHQPKALTPQHLSDGQKSCVRTVAGRGWPPDLIVDNPHLTVLEGSLMEGAADFVGELVAGNISYAYLPALTRGREKEIETAFVADEDKTDLSDWINNSTLEKPADLGYWVGYRITKAYYQHATDKRQALHDILQMTDAKAFLAKSGWYPGIQLQ